MQSDSNLNQFLRAARQILITMALLKILHYPDPRLNKVAQPIAQVDDTLRKLVADMAETMYAAPASASPPPRWTATCA